MKMISTFFIAGLLLSLCAVSHAFEVQLAGNNAAGILNLDIDGMFYDVMFEFVPGPHVASLSSDIFAHSGADETGAQAAVAAINAALNTSNATTVGTGSGNASTYIVPYLYNDPVCDTLCGKRGSSGFTISGWAGPTQADIDTNLEIQFARFPPAAVPLPPAVFLFPSGLAMLGWVRRRGVRARVC